MVVSVCFAQYNKERRGVFSCGRRPLPDTASPSHGWGIGRDTAALGNGPPRDRNAPAFGLMSFTALKTGEPIAVNEYPESVPERNENNI